jgi:hypothetical protein
MQEKQNRPSAFRLFGKFCRITCLWSLMVFEIIVWASFKYFGWNESLRLGGVSAFLLIAGLPLLVAAGLLLWSWRLSIRRMLIAISLIAFFLAAVAVPYQRFSVDRHASLALTSAGAYLANYDESQQYPSAKADNRKPTTSSQLSAFTVLSEKTIKWLLPSMGKCPLDLEVCEVRVQYDRQLNALLSQADRLPNLREIHFGGEVSSNAIAQFADASLFPRLEVVTIECSNKFLSESLKSFRGLKRIILFTQSQLCPALPKRLARIVTELDGLEMVHLAGISVTSNDLAEWGEAEIKILSLWATKSILTRTDLCRFSIVSPDIELYVYPVPKQ